MRVCVNTLSIGSLSGQHVVLGFLSRLIPWTEGEHEFVLLHNERSRLPEALLRPNVETIPLPARLRRWTVRMAWELTQLRPLLRLHGCEVLLNPSGALIPNLTVRQAVLCQNPWCFVPAAHQNLADRAKARLQRIGYRRAFRSADVMFYISDHLRGLYRRDAGAGPEAPGEITYVGINDATFAAAASAPSNTPRDPNLVVSASAMAPWKGTETLVAAIAQVRRDGCPARLRLVGPWPDSRYEARIRRQIVDAGLDDVVEITGHVSREKLHRHYAEARVFALLSHCESFGIPAAEAQAFGTPAVVAAGCAMPEVCGDGALPVPPGSPSAAAEKLRLLLESPADWSRLSRAASNNAQRFRWDVTTRPLLKLFNARPERAAPPPPTPLLRASA